MNHFTLILNAGRSGSTYLYEVIKLNYGEECYVAHEDIPVQVSKPRLYNRAYSKDRVNLIKSDRDVMTHVKKWEKELLNRPVIETGWTSYHLCPLLLDVFGDRFQIILMHRDPISFAFSRANMGNYHPNTFYDDAHEVSPFDPFSIAPQKKDIWAQMNHFERCMYWWYVVYQEGLEFIENHPEVPSMIVKSDDIFKLKRLDEVISFLKLDRKRLHKTDVNKNPLSLFMRETFPLKDEWKKYREHQDILNFAKQLGGYQFCYDQVANKAEKYKLPKGLGPWLRNKTNYWKVKANIKKTLFLEKTKSVFGNFIL